MNFIRLSQFVLAIFLLQLTPAWASLQSDRQILVSVEWLNKELQRPGLLIIDTRAPELYRAAHIPGAINIPTNLTFASPEQAYRLGGLQQISHLFSQHGIRREHQIVLYDDGNYIDAARFFWVLEVYGHEQVALLNGGIPLWRKFNYPLEAIPRQRPTSNYIPNINHHRITSRSAMQIATKNPAVRIIDARTPQEFAGQESQAKRAGHIPRAQNIPWNSNLIKAEQDLETLMSDSQLRHQYQPYKDKKVITYCNRGKQSALTYFVLRQIGYDVSVYDGAWLEWANDVTLPIE